MPLPVPIVPRSSCAPLRTPGNVKAHFCHRRLIPGGKSKLKRDLIIGIVGAVILIAAMVGVFRYEAARAGTAFDYDWRVEAGPGPQLSGETAEGSRSDVTMDVEQPHLASLTFVLSWVDDIGEPDEFRFTVITPEGDSQTIQGSSGRLEVTFDELAPQPLPGRILAADETAARERVEGQLPSAGLGTWSFRIELLQAGDETAPIAGLPPITEDTGNTWKLETQQGVYAPVISRV